MSAEMYVRTYWDVQRVLDEFLGTEEEHGSGGGIAADVYLLGQQRDEARVEVERLQTKLADYRVRLVAAEADLLDVRGVLSPNGEPERTPVPLVPTVAPAVQWLADEIERLRAIAAEPTEET